MKFSNIQQIYFNPLEKWWIFCCFAQWHNNCQKLSDIRNFLKLTCSQLLKSLSRVAGVEVSMTQAQSAEQDEHSGFSSIVKSSKLDGSIWKWSILASAYFRLIGMIDSSEYCHLKVRSFDGNNARKVSCSSIPKPAFCIFVPASKIVSRMSTLKHFLRKISLLLQMPSCFPQSAITLVNLSELATTTRFLREDEQSRLNIRILKMV